MSYLSTVPTYIYDLPCGHEFRSRTPSEPDEDDGMHWFFCVRCRSYKPVIALVGGRPLYASGSKRVSETQLSVMLDRAIVRDRIAAFYADVWSNMTILQVAAALGVSVRQVRHVSDDLGVYESDARDLGDHYR